MLFLFSEILQNKSSTKSKIVVVYDENMAEMFHPLPGCVRINRHHDPVVIESSLSLRSQIATPASPYSQAIKEHENTIACYPDSITDEQVEKYLEVVSLAETLMLREAEVVLCTCAASSSSKMMRHCNILQV